MLQKDVASNKLKFKNKLIMFIKYIYIYYQEKLFDVFRKNNLLNIVDNHKNGFVIITYWKLFNRYLYSYWTIFNKYIISIVENKFDKYV